MIELEVRNSRYVTVGVKLGSVKVEPELLSKSEQEDLADHLLRAIWDLAPEKRDDAYEWLRERLEANGIEVARLQPEGE
jgi:hypothetical protein